jgi:hypothetical protein
MTDKQAYEALYGILVHMVPHYNRGGPWWAANGGATKGQTHERR